MYKYDQVNFESVNNEVCFYENIFKSNKLCLQQKNGKI